MSKRFRYLIPALAVLICSGCVTAEGVGLPSSDSYVNKGFVKYGTLPDSSVETQTSGSSSPVTGMIAVGTVSAFRELKPDDVAAEYKKYARDFEVWNVERPPILGPEEFSTLISGWTRIKIMGVPLLFAGYVKALVPIDAAVDVDFEPAVATALFQSSSDLVAAKTNPDGVFSIVSLLCKDQAGYSDCAKDYKKGVFDSKTGLKIGGKMKLVEDGPRIDPVTFRLISPESR